MITTTLEISTGHVTEKDAKLLDTEETQKALPLMYTNEYGWMFYSPDLIANMEDFKEICKAQGLSDDFYNLFVYAFVHLNVDRLRLDRDGDVHPGLPEWEW